MIWTLRPPLGDMVERMIRTPRQRLAIEYAERFANDHASIDDAFVGRLRGLFTDPEVLDLTLCLAVFLGLGRSLTVLGVDQSCAIDL